MQPRSEKIISLIYRVLLALAVGFAVCCVSLLVVWRLSTETLMSNRLVDRWSSWSMQKTDEAIQARLMRGDTAPASLRELAPELRKVTFPHGKKPILRDDWPVDGWGRPLLYSTQGTTYTLQTLGRDGAPGGRVFDRDLDRSNYMTTLFAHETTDDIPPMPSLRRFIFELPSGGMIRSCLLSGLVAFIAALVVIRPGLMTRERAWRMALSLLLTAIVSVLFAWLVMQLHIPVAHS